MAGLSYQDCLLFAFPQPQKLELVLLAFMLFVLAPGFKIPAGDKRSADLQVFQLKSNTREGIFFLP